MFKLDISNQSIPFQSVRICEKNGSSSSLEEEDLLHRSTKKIKEGEKTGLEGFSFVDKFA